jgi:hypothetical protein
MIIPNGQQFTAVCRNGKMFTWPDYNEIGTFKNGSSFETKKHCSVKIHPFI